MKVLKYLISSARIYHFDGFRDWSYILSIQDLRCAVLRCVEDAVFNGILGRVVEDSRFTVSVFNRFCHHSRIVAMLRTTSAFSKLICLV